MMSGVLSVEPSSISVSRQSCQVCASTLSIAAPTVAAALWAIRLMSMLGATLTTGLERGPVSRAIVKFE